MNRSSEGFAHHERDKLSRSSAEIILSILLQMISPQSAIDVGCGVGTWLSVLKAKGIKDVLGLDGSCIQRRHLVIADNEFMVCNLDSPPTLNRKWDLAISLEVAEHLDSSKADRFVDYLTRIAPCVLFSAAIPFQGGVNHRNEQWQEYWADHFSKRNYLAIDCLRGRIWNNKDIRIWYKQNILLFAREDLVAVNSKLRDGYEKTNYDQINLVHPDYYLQKANRPGNINEAILLLRYALLRPIKNKLARMRGCSPFPFTRNHGI